MKSGNKMKEDKFSIKTKHLFYYRRKKGFNCLIYYLIRRNDFTVLKSIAKLHDNSFKFCREKKKATSSVMNRKMQKENAEKKLCLKNFPINVFHSFYKRQIMYIDIRSVNIWWKAWGDGEVIKKLPMK